MKLLILGGAGYIGSILTRQALAAGHSVTCVDNLRYHQGHTQFDLLAHPAYKFKLTDIREFSAIRSAVFKADVVINLAAMVGAPVCDRHPQEAEQVHVAAVKPIIAALGNYQRYLYPNTNSGYGTVRDGICTESTPMRPISVYGRTKLEAEDLALEHPNTVVFRLATVFGISPRMRLDLLVNTLVYHAVTQKHLRIYGGGLRRNYIYVGDIAKCFLWALQPQRLAGQVFNLGLDSANMTKMELAQVICCETGAKMTEDPTIEDPDKRDYLVSSQKLHDAGFAPTTSLTDGIAELQLAYQMLPTDKAERDLVTRRMNTLI